MKKFRTKNNIYIQDWLQLKPYEKQLPTDIYYLKLANKVKQQLLRLLPDEAQAFFSQEELNLFACFLTSYFEDIVSETNIWNTFVEKHKELYKKELPFFDTDEEYIQGEINYQDVGFLIWYFVNTVQETELLHPTNFFIYLTSIGIMEIFEEEFEMAPENDYLKNYYQLNTADEEDFYAVRTLVKKLLIDTYLFYIDSGLEYNAIIEDTISEVENEEEDFNRLQLFLREQELAFFNNKHTKLLNLKGKEWAAFLLGKTHPLYDDILNMSDRLAGFFFRRGEDEHNYFIEYIASGTTFNLTKKSLTEPLPYTKEDDLLYIGIQKWQGEWWFCGNLFPLSFDADLILDQKNSVEMRKKINFTLSDKDKELIKSILKEQEQAFLKFNNGSPIAFLSESETIKFQQKYIEFYNNTLGLSKKEKEDANQRARQEGLFFDDINFLPENQENAEDDRPAIVFFNSKSGVEIAFGINSAFPHPENKFFVEEESLDNLFGLIVSDYFSAELVHYCIDNYKDKLLVFEDKEVESYLEDLDFTLRFFKNDNYHAQPEITLTGTNHLKAV